MVAAAPPAHVPPSDQFRGRIVSATGAYRGAKGRVEVDLKPRGSGSTRRVRVTVRDRPCRKAGRCLKLDGTLSGTLTEYRPPIPDTGSKFVLRASGRITPLGTTRGGGTGYGTGFIARGNETLILVLHGARGEVKLSLQSPPVRGFTSP